MDFLNANFNKWFESHLSFLKKTYHGKKKARYFQKLSSFKVLTTRKKMGKNSHVNFQVWTSLELPRQQKWSTNWKNINFLVFLVLTMTMKKGQRTEGTYTNYVFKFYSRANCPFVCSYTFISVPNIIFLQAPEFSG